MIFLTALFSLLGSKGNGKFLGKCLEFVPQKWGLRWKGIFKKKDVFHPSKIFKGSSIFICAE
jgi:hypothetical protein